MKSGGKSTAGRGTPAPCAGTLVTCISTTLSPGRRAAGIPPVTWWPSAAIVLDAEECREYAEEVSLNAVAYLADMYAAVFPECPGNWDPMDNYDYENPEFVHLAKTEIEVCIKRAGRWR